MRFYAGTRHFGVVTEGRRRKQLPYRLWPVWFKVFWWSMMAAFTVWFVVTYRPV